MKWGYWGSAPDVAGLHRDLAHKARSAALLVKQVRVRAAIVERRETMKLNLARFLTAALLLLLSQPAFADKRVALVIGNSAYQNAPLLANPTNDSAMMESMF